MDITVKKDIDSKNFQPVFTIVLTGTNEFMQDTQAIKGRDGLIMTVGTAVVEALESAK